MFTEANIEFLQLTLEKFDKPITYLREYNYLTASVIVTQLKRPPVPIYFVQVVTLMMIRMMTCKNYYSKVLLVIAC